MNPPNFDRVARAYRILEWTVFQNALQTARLAHLPRLAQSRNALLIGDGDGRFLARLAQFRPGLRITVLDASRTMLDNSKARWHRIAPRGAQSPRWLHQTVESLSPENEEFDAVVSHFFFDMFPSREQAALVKNVTQTVADDALWLWADFRHPDSPWAQWPGNALLRLMYAFFALTTGLTQRCLQDPSDALRQHGWQRQVKTLTWSGFIRSECWRRTRTVRFAPS